MARPCHRGFFWMLWSLAEQPLDRSAGARVPAAQMPTRADLRAAGRADLERALEAHGGLAEVRHKAQPLAALWWLLSTLELGSSILIPTSAQGPLDPEPDSLAKLAGTSHMSPPAFPQVAKRMGWKTKHNRKPKGYWHSFGPDNLCPLLLCQSRRLEGQALPFLPFLTSTSQCLCRQCRSCNFRVQRGRPIARGGYAVSGQSD